MSFRTTPVGILLCLFSLSASAWWNDDWTSRRQITVDAGITGADIKETLTDFPLLVRLHTGNFAYFAELAENGRDVRFLLDDKTALKHSIEKLDAVNELGLVWVKLPQVRGGVSTDNFWLYYGNDNAADASDSKGLYDVHQALVYHFTEGEAIPRDATAYAMHAADSKALIEPAGWIGAAAKFDGSGHIEVKAAPPLEINPDNGWTFSSWIRIDAPQQSGVVFLAQDGPNRIELDINGAAASALYLGPGNQSVRGPAVELQVGKWQHVAVVARKDALELFVDGQSAGSAAINLVPMNPTLFIGGTDTRTHLVGLLDEVQVAKQARGADWIKLGYRSQSPDFTVLNHGEDESKGASGGPNYFVIILQSLTVDGWVVIALCGVMFVISMLVIVTKSLTLKRARQDNQAFLDQYRGMGAGSDLAALDREETEEEKELSNSAFLAAIAGKHDHFQSSPIYHIYHAGVAELKKRLSDTRDTTHLSAEAINVVRTRLDTAVVREGQKLNKNMVLLTIAISGGPFLGLLGTVLGVMITFAVIAATGDVNINSIAPGISGALLATVAGLAVAIPALFAYNYLLTQIKDVTADMKVFTDEFLANVEERIADRQRGV
jgi:biopolymer transport protein ExbB